MSFLKRLFGMDKLPEFPASLNPLSGGGGGASGTAIAPERMGLNGEYDQSGLAKRVALAFDMDMMLRDIDTIHVAQTGSTVVLKGSIASQDLLQKMVGVARSTSGAMAVDTSQVKII
jgi:hypothetical protein